MDDKAQLIRAWYLSNLLGMQLTIQKESLLFWHGCKYCEYGHDVPVLKNHGNVNVKIWYQANVSSRIYFGTVLERPRFEIKNIQWVHVSIIAE